MFSTMEKPSKQTAYCSLPPVPAHSSFNTHHLTLLLLPAVVQD